MREPILPLPTPPQPIQAERARDVIPLHLAGALEAQGFAGYDPADDENPWWNAELGARALVAALEALCEGRTEDIEGELRAFAQAYDKGELDAFAWDATLEMEATFCALALVYAPALIATWCLPAPRFVVELLS